MSHNLEGGGKGAQQGAATLRLMAKSSQQHHFIFNEVWRHRHHHLK